MFKNQVTNLLENGLRLGDHCQIYPYQGRKKDFGLNRKEFEFNLEAIVSIHKNGFIVELPALLGEQTSFVLKLVSLIGGNSHEEDDLRYLLRSNEGHAFKVNGNYVFECYLQRGDRIDLGYNRIIFSNKQAELDSSSYLSTADSFLDNKLVLHNINILIEGETGTGKTRLAKMIHEKSNRVGGFVHLNLSAFSPSLIESELFGHTKGAFTGADKEKKGAILEANYGTLFLDEIDSLPIEIQTKLLLFLDSKMVRPVGGNQNIKTDVRLIFAAGKKLKNLVKDNLMRKDFYFRLISGGKIFLPSIKDSPELIEFLCSNFSMNNDVYISKKLVDFYKTIYWPGNIRQLLGHLKKKKILSSGRRLEYDEVDQNLMLEDSNFDESHFHDSFRPFSDIKKEYFQKVFMYYEENYLLAAKVLKISPQTLKTTINKVVP